MKTLLSTVVFFAATVTLMAGTQNIYVEDWGTTNGGTSVTGNGNFDTVGWTAAAVSQTAGPYLGIYAATGASDPGTGAALPVNTVYFTGLLPSQTSPGMFYTTDALGAGSGGDSSFTDINPANYTNLAINVEIMDRSTGDTNYFAVQVGGSWYVATSFPLPYDTALGYPEFTNVTLIYTNPANVWQSLTVSSTSVTIGAVATPNLTSPITGVGIVELPTSNGANYNELSVTAYSPTGSSGTPASITSDAVSPQSAYVGGGASFLILAAGTPPLTYVWKTNGIPIGNDPRFIGANTNELTITNLTAADGSVTYSVTVSNSAGSATNGNLSLDISAVPSGVLYAEDFPYVGPNGNLPISGVGWVSSASASTVVGIYESGTGQGDVFSYAPSATTNIYYTTDTNDFGLSGLPFEDINAANYPAITLQAGFVPGNAAGQVSGAISVYWAVAINGNWYCSAQPQSIALGALSPYQTYQYGFNPAAANWNTVTITGTNAIIGGPPSGPLTGNITGAGLIIAHNDSSGSDMNFQDFEITTNSAVGTAPSIGTDIPLSVGVASGGGASFGVSAASGTPPFGYYWTTNGVVVGNGPNVSGATSATLTLANLTAADNGMSIVAYVTNAAGYDYSDSIYPAAILTVTNAPVGDIYSESFPFVGPVSGDYPISSIGWVEAVVNVPSALYQVNANSSQGAVFAYLGGPGTTVYYTTTATDTNQAGVPFPNINLDYPNLTFSVDIAPDYQSSNVTAYLAVQLNNGSWYVSASALPVPTSVDSSTFSTYTTAFNPAAANWKNLTVTSSGGLIGAPAASNLKGVMIGAGLVFVTVGTGGTFDFANFGITGTGPGGINIGPISGGSSTLTWVGNPAVELQSSTNLLNRSGWQNVPNTYGLYSLPVTTTGHQQYFRLKTP
jgi:Immunoglobulin I-set domain